MLFEHIGAGLDFTLNELLKLGEVGSEALLEILVVGLDRGCVPTGILFESHVKVEDERLDRTTDSYELVACVLDLLDLDAKFFGLISGVRLLLIAAAFETLHDALKDNTLDLLLGNELLLAADLCLHLAAFALRPGL